MTTNTATNEFAAAFNAYKNATYSFEAADRMLDADPENEVLITVWDAAYRVEHEAFERLVNVTVGIVAPHVAGFTAKTARAMLLKNDEKLAEMVACLAA